MTTNIKTLQIINETLTPVYGRFGFVNDGNVAQQVLAFLNNTDESARHVDAYTPSNAAENVRELLWSHYSGGSVSASVTKELFTKINRAHELGYFL